ncbi:MAG: alkaline phosphatase family protein [Deltaproteobacteria bacterium]|nr:alkaline phosphatase family protein [Deltaproteobacteria bacterium]
MYNKIKEVDGVARRAGRARWPALPIAMAALVAPAAAHAYIDPGTAGMVVGGALGALSSALLAVVFLWRHLLRLLRWSMGMLRRPLVLIPVMAALLLGGGGLWFWTRGGEQEMQSVTVASGERFERVVLLGVDGVDPDDLRALLERDLLPNFARIVQAGGLHDLEIPMPAVSPVVWSTLATGRNPGGHGIFDFLGRDPARYLPRLAVLRQEGDSYRFPIGATALWDLTTQHKLPTVVVRWPLTFPPKPVNGRILAGLGVPDLRGGLGRYTVFTDRAPADDDESRDKVQVVQLQERAFTGKLTGPSTRTLHGLKPLTVEVQGQLDAAAPLLKLRVGKQQLVLNQGVWSDWVDLRFSAGLFASHRGMVKFLLNSAREPFELYATAVEMHPEAPVVDFTQPPGYSRELAQAIGLYHTLGMPEDTKAYGEGHLSQQSFFEMCDGVESERRAMMLHELERFERGLLAVVFDTSDRLQHMTPHAGDVAATAIGRYLIDFDGFVGAVLDKLPPRTPLIVFSDHGFSEFRRAVDLNRWLVDHGYLQIDREAYQARAAGDSGELYKYVQWDRTQAYAVGFSSIYVNLAGREGQGSVAEEERVEVAARIARELTPLVDAERGERVIHAVYERQQLYTGPHAEQAPDLVVGYRPGYRGSWQSAVGGLAEQVLSDNNKTWQRDHIVDASFVQGTLLTNFEIAGDRVRAVDLAPTVMELLGLPVPADMEGRSWLRPRDVDIAATPAVHAAP